jgi:recombination protein RecA
MSNFNEIISKFNKDSRSEIISNGLKVIDISRISFSSPYLNYMLHGGFPRGKVVEFFGAEGSGKTTTALDIVANAQKQFKKEFDEQLKQLEGATKKTDIEKFNELKTRGPLKCVYFDLEHTLDYHWAKQLGVDLENNFWLVDPEAQSAEDLLDLLISLVKSNEVGLIVLDSVPYLEPAAILTETLEKKEYGGVSKLLTAFLRKVTPYLNATTASLLFINQLRDSMNPYKLYDTPGGRGLKHACSVRLMFQKGQLLDEALEPTKRSSETAFGNEVLVKIEKTKICKPDRLVGKYTLAYYSGIEWVYDLLEILINKGVVLQAGSWIQFTNPETGEPMEQYRSQGKTKSVATLKSNPQLLDTYIRYVEKYVINSEDK